MAEVWANDIHNTFYKAYLHHRGCQPDEMWALYTEADNDMPEIRELNRLKNQFLRALRKPPSQRGLRSAIASEGKDELLSEIRRRKAERKAEQKAAKASAAKESKCGRPGEPVTSEGSNTGLPADAGSGTPG